MYYVQNSIEKKIIYKRKHSTILLRVLGQQKPRTQDTNSPQIRCLCILTQYSNMVLFVQ